MSDTRIDQARAIVFGDLKAGSVCNMTTEADAGEPGK
jgi:hypothetical protein